MRPHTGVFGIFALLACAVCACTTDPGLDPSSTFGGEPTPFGTPMPVTIASNPVVALGFLPNGTACAASGSMVYFSADSGMTWGAAAHFPSGENVQKLSIDGSGTIYLGADSLLERLDPHEINPRSTNILRSTDGGTSWATVWRVERPIVKDVVLACDQAGDLLAGYYPSGYALSRNKGLNWTRVTGYWCSGGAISTSRVYFTASVKGNVRRSDDLGETWTICPGLPGEGSGAYGEMLTTPRADTVFVVESSYGVLYRSVTGGTSWAPVWMGIVTNLCRSPGGILYFASGDLLYRSVNGGANWFIAGRPGAEIASIAVSNTGVVLVGTTRGTIIRWQEK